MTDLELFKAIARAVTGVATHEVSQAVAKVRALLAEAPASKALDPERKATSGRNRQYIGGRDRSFDGGDAA